MNGKMDYKQILNGIFVPGKLYPSARAFYFFIFLLLTIAQTYCALLMEEQLAYEDKYPRNEPENFIYQNYQ
jgi:hypothetical protein